VIDHQLGSWLIVSGLLTAVGLLIRHWPVAGSVSSDRLNRVGVWMVDRFRPVPEFDPIADDMYRVHRREQLRADVQRVQRLIATDMAMSATRQLGNRLAYAQLMREVEGARDLVKPIPINGALTSWTVFPLPVQPANMVTGYSSKRAPNVETLDIGWRH
jgi:hypothetical protein